MASELFTPMQELQILAELTRLGYVAECSPRGPGVRGHWIVEAEPPQPCIMVCPSIHLETGRDDTGEVALLLFPDGHRILHCGYSGLIERLDPQRPLEDAVLQTERFAAVEA